MTTIYQIRFYGEGITSTVIPELSDEAIEAARTELESKNGQPFPLDERTNYPSFTVYEGEQTEEGHEPEWSEVGGG